MKTLRAWRAERLMSTRLLAERAGASNKTIVQIESGRHVPSYATIAKICRALDVSPRDVVEFARAMDTRGGSAVVRTAQSSPTTIPKRRIFCASESLDVLALVQRLLEAGQYDVTTLIGTADAFEAIAAAQPDIVIVELEAGQPFGWDLLNRLRSEPATLAIPVVVRASNTWLVERSDTRATLGDAPLLPASTFDREFHRLVSTVDSLTPAR